ncbi:MAG: beta-galactosidase [Chitinophagaceae bacterium]|nr:beta-galactosidase [Chitinophagaceae bacterium]
MKRCLLFSLLALCSFAVQAQAKHDFSLSKDGFFLDGRPFQIISGEMHPARIPREYWQHRIQMAKAMGCNTIAAYIFWNYHESTPGKFDFKTGNHDIASFIKLCQQEGLWVLLRPGPYVCAEWDLGGLPPYLLKIPDIKLRCMDPRYMAAVKTYVDRLAKEVAPLQCSKGGPILMVQVENEYGSYGNDKEYLETLRKFWIAGGINVPFYTADGATPFMLDAGHIAGAAIGLDSGGNEGDFEQARKHDPTVPSFSSETYPGWLTHWGEKFAKPDTNDLKNEMAFLLKNHKSFNLYVIHGGTNFGLTAGANSFSPTQYQPDITSYDYDAPIDEQGRATPKYHMLRQMIGSYTDRNLPAIPAAVPSMDIPSFEMHGSGSIWDNIAAAPIVRSAQPLSFEAMGQDQGFVLYRTKLIGHKKGKLTITAPHDYALVFLEKKFIDTVWRDGGKWTVELPAIDPAVKDPLLEILVEGMGHINFAQYMIDRKGITERVTLNGMTLMNWEMVLVPVNEKFVPKGNDKQDPRPGHFFSGDFTLDKTADTFFDLSGYSKGLCFINGHLLGRYWNIGPQQRLYCPASWLKKGKNELLVFDQHQLQAAPVSGKQMMN